MTGQARSARRSRSAIRRISAAGLGLLVLWAAHVHRALGAEKPCQPVSGAERWVLVVEAFDTPFVDEARRIEASLRRLLRQSFPELQVLPTSATHRALTAEGNQRARVATLDEARVLLAQADDSFRQLDDESALALLAQATAKLAAVHQEDAAVPLLAEAHLLAGAIYLARDRIDAARARLRRALDLAPALAPSRERYSPRVLAELAWMRDAEDRRPKGLLNVTVSNPGVDAEVFVDGRSLGRAPVSLSTGAGRHLLRISATGWKSHITAVDVPADGEARVGARLPPDDEVREILSLGAAWRARSPLEEILTSVAERAGADRALVAIPALAAPVGQDGRTAYAVELRLSGVPRAAFSSSTEPSALGQLVGALSRCEPVPAQPSIAPLLLLDATGSPTSRHVPSPEAFWQKPWFWALTAALAVGSSSALVMLRAQAGPPSALEITLIPRP